jgi:hypothetical protein
MSPSRRGATAPGRRGGGVCAPSSPSGVSGRRAGLPPPCTLPFMGDLLLPAPPGLISSTSLTSPLLRVPTRRALSLPWFRGTCALCATRPLSPPKGSGPACAPGCRKGPSFSCRKLTGLMQTRLSGRLISWVRRWFTRPLRAQPEAAPLVELPSYSLRAPGSSAALCWSLVTRSRRLCPGGGGTPAHLLLLPA